MEIALRNLDHLRVRLLALTMRSFWLRFLYARNAHRLFGSFVLLSLFYAPIAFRRPELLLFFGPFVLGYPHLVASYRFLQPRSRIAAMKPFVFFSLVTACSTGLHELLFAQRMVPEMPLGAWEVITSTLVAIFVSRQFLPVLICGAGGWALWEFAWREPLLNVAIGLLLHNWVGFFVWIRSARGPNRIAALAASSLFGLIHLWVFSGGADFLFGEIRAGAQSTGAILAPWSSDLVTWHRAVVLYTFGLSLHYFVWLKAIPECGLKYPVSWKRSFERLKSDLGPAGLGLVLMGVAAGLGTWLFRTELGSRVYFQVAILHGSLELMFLLASVKVPVSLLAWGSCRFSAFFNATLLPRRK